jgi:hypothetical protein
MPNAANKLRETFLANPKPLTSNEIKKLRPDLKPSEISMALSYLKQARYLTRELIPNPTRMARKDVWLYRYHPERLDIK